ncbi:hypothetical protein GCM10012275_15290 [Longimycelium tulufanense]|uniref:Toprim domain-containing protein n=1 Tax=Longimycelium tulufanense TaxID=907463 RepID=A0A8J3FT22_9PSEU|nr:topoisomerase [Longimycelium tulufanense]GGM45163.1 hypothetical protein GCM10012275_15290 [Longimycelium tulufanense]
MQKLCDAQRKSLVEATTCYHASLVGSPAEEYLAKERGLAMEEVGRFRLGFVADPLPGHERYRGWLAIPYLRWSPTSGWTVVAMRFRCIENHDHKEHRHSKYMSLPGMTTRLFNTPAVLQTHDEIGVAEGEIDTVTASVTGVPTVGVSGADAWLRRFRRIFLGYRRVWVFADGDVAGRKFAERVCGDLPNAQPVTFADNEDVNSVFAAHGKAGLLERMGI